MGLDEEIKATEELVLSLRQQHNALIPAVNAPTDILYAIFSFYPAKPERQLKLSRPPTWLAILKVCSRWQQTYVSTPTLWSEPGRIGLPEMADIAELFVQRANGVPTDLWFHFDDHDSLGVRLPKALAAVVSWLRSLKITGQEQKLAKYLRVLDHTPAPRLETLRIELASDEYTDGHDLRKCKLFAGTVPALRVLALKNCIFRWESPLLSVITLTELNIAGHSSLERPTLEGFLAILQRFPALKFIRLKNCLPDIAHRIAHDQYTHVELPHLNHFELISDSPFALHAVAAHVRVPTSSKFVIRCGNYSFSHQVQFDEQHVQALADAVLSHVFVHGALHQPRDGIHIDQHLLALCSDEITRPYESFLELGTMRYSDSDDLDTPFDFMRKSQSWEAFIGLNLSWDQYSEPNPPYILQEGLTMRVYETLLSNIPLDLLKGLHISGDVFREPEMLIRSFHSAKNVESLTLSGEVQSAALEVMSGLINFADPLSSEPLFPSLKRMCICELPPDAIMMDGNMALTHLQATLQRRRDADQDVLGGLRMLDRLGLFHSLVPAAQVEELGPFVTHGSVDLIRAGDNVDGQ